MILLLSRRDDGSTKEVAEWLYALDKKFIRINTDDKGNEITGCNIQNENFHLMLNGKEHKISLKDVKSVWNRRSGFSKETLIRDESLSHSFQNDIPVGAHLNDEAAHLFDYLYFMLESNDSIQRIGSQRYNIVNKLKVLKIARECGLNVPDSYVITKKEELLELAKKKKLITKAIGNGVYSITERLGYYSYTEGLTKVFIKKLPESFFPSLIQEKIEKLYELRAFYLKGKFYSMAIFSQEAPQTQIDCRKCFSSKHAPRNVPYKLPYEIELKLKNIMDKLCLNTGSIDMIVSKEKQFIFLEVNPIGQFGMTSKPCNYYLEKKIAEIL